LFKSNGDLSLGASGSQLQKPLLDGLGSRVDLSPIRIALRKADEDVMFLVCPVDANSCLVGKWRRNIHKHLIAVYDLSRRKRVGTGYRKLYSLFVESDEFVLRIRLTRSVTDLLDQLEGRPSEEVILFHS